MGKKQKTLIDIYLEYQTKYTEIYGSNAVVFMQVGSFYESYSTETEGFNLKELERILHTKFTRRDTTTNKPPDRSNPNLLGFPCVSLSKNLAILVENNYTVVVFDQITVEDDEIERILTGVYSPGTYIGDKQQLDGNYNVIAYIVEEKQLKSLKGLFAIGVVIVDVSTGNSTIHEFYSSKDDERFGLDELCRILEVFNPTEVLVYYHPMEIDDEVVAHIKKYLDLDRYHNHFYIYHDKKGSDQLELLQEQSFQLTHQNVYFSTIFGLNKQSHLNKGLSSLEILDLVKKPYATIALLIMLRFISEHNIGLLKNLSYPTIYCYKKHLILGNNAIEQLNIINSNNLDTYNKKIDSVFSVINKTSTPMGRRFLKENLTNPISQENKQLILSRYEMIDTLLTDKLYKKISSELKLIHDVEKLHRKMAMGTCTPYDFYRLDQYYQSTTKILKIIRSNKVLSGLIGDDQIKNFLSYLGSYNTQYVFKELHKYTNFSDIQTSLFHQGIHTQLDAIQKKIDRIWNITKATVNYFIKLIEPECKKTKKELDLITTEYTDRDGYYISLTKTRETILKRKLKNLGSNIQISLSAADIFTFKHTAIEFKSLPKGKTKIFIKPLINHTNTLIRLNTRLAKLSKKLFVTSILNFYDMYNEVLRKITDFIAHLDFLVGGATVAAAYHYCKPEIPSRDSQNSGNPGNPGEKIPSYLIATDLRHPIVERLCTDTEYVPNDVELGNVPEDLNEDSTATHNFQDNGYPRVKTYDKCGIVVYGLNSSGKSVFMKAIGVSVIMAQIGYYVPAARFVYEPYNAVFARIRADDNLFKGLSSFHLEMTELEAILKRTVGGGDKTLVIGDEICKGTESISGLSIVASMLMHLSESRCSFIFSSHLHQLPDLPEIKALTNLRFYHLKVEYDQTNDCLVFYRKLQPGTGPSVYGLQVAKFLIKDSKFIQRAEIIKNRLIAQLYPSSREIINTKLPIKKSNYNKHRLTEYCEICFYRPTQDHHKELETHHINPQCDCNEDGKIKSKLYLQKNELYNIVTLCRKCHMKLDTDELVIRGYLDTSRGPMLDYHINTKLMIGNQLDKIRQLEQ